MNEVRAVVVPEPGRLEIRTFPMPTIGEDDGVIEVELVGVCGSDPGIFKGKRSRAPRPYPIILGHEVVGRVLKMGRRALERRGLKEGDRVIVEYAFGCGQCRACLEGRYTLCERHYSYGSMISCAEPPHLFGGYATHMYIHPRAMVHKIGEEISPEVGVLICAVLGNAVRWLVHEGGLQAGQSVAIVGPGQQGLAGVIVARWAGAGPVIVLGLKRDQHRLEMARALGADEVVMVDEEDPVEAVARATAGAMAQVVMDTSGHPSGAPLALAVAGRGARVVLPGIYGRPVEVDLDRAVFNELKLVGVFSHDFRAVEPAIALARAFHDQLKAMITHGFGLAEAQKALKIVAGELPEAQPIKVVLDPSM